MGTAVTVTSRRSLARLGFSSFSSILKDKLHPLEMAKLTSSNKNAHKHRTLTVCIDFETTGLSTAKEHITQIGAIAIGEEEGFATYVYTDRRIPAKVTEVTGITSETIQGAPIFPEAWKLFCAWLKSNANGREVNLVAHNGFRFDYPILVHEMERHRMDPKACLSSFMFSDSLPACRSVFSHMNSRSLGAIYMEIVGQELPNAHDALADCAGLAKVNFIRISLLAESPQPGIILTNAISET